MFRFRLQRVLDLRRQKEQAEAQRLAEAQRAEESARETCAQLDAQREEGARHAAEAQGSAAKVGQLQNLRFLVEQIGQHAELAREAHDAARQVVAERTEDFTVAFRERRVLDKLRERHLEGWRIQEVQDDRQRMDGIALSRFTRKTGNTPGEGSTKS